MRTCSVRCDDVSFTLSLSCSVNSLNMPGSRGGYTCCKIGGRGVGGGRGEHGNMEGSRGGYTCCKMGGGGGGGTW